MTTTTQTTTLEQLAAMFNDKQIAAIKLVINRGFWGDTDLIFDDKKEYSADGFFTNGLGGKEWSGAMSGISRTIKKAETNLIASRSDWWGDGNGDMLFINTELIDADELRDWAKQ